MPKPAKDLTGIRVGSVVAVRVAGVNPHGKKLWAVRCDCGTEKVVEGTDFARGNYQSCGCRRASLIGARNSTHGMSEHPAFAVWASMKARCQRENHPAWANYGGRGIKVCPKWSDSFEAFWEDMGPTYVSGLTLDREDNSGDYSPENCRWTGWTTQARNKRGNVHVDTEGFGRVTVKEAAERSGLKYTTLLYRLKSGCPTELALTLPPDPSRNLP